MKVALRKVKKKMPHLDFSNIVLKPMTLEHAEGVCYLGLYELDIDKITLIDGAITGNRSRDAHKNILTILHEIAHRMDMKLEDTDATVENGGHGKTFYSIYSSYKRDMFDRSAAAGATAGAVVGKSVDAIGAALSK